MTDAYLFAEQRFDIQPLRLQDFAQTAQAFNLNLANTFTGEANFTTYIFHVLPLRTPANRIDVPVLHAVWRSARTAI